MVPSDASLEITKDSDPIPSSTVSVGDTITYELTISNTGSITLPNVIVQDVLDSHLD
ncbi:DUF11 domain-containing protein, partial [Candidatus Gracilibacteria bacterium]|nr:DUF11 domain-containing protein [Candidatus Gracilibacteria bacterium]MCF7819823.1 DUF11 domain-containing protein [Candidatus Gracilibacteria bacterium]